MQKPIRIWKALLRCVLIVLTLLQGISFSPAVAQTPVSGEDFSIYLTQNTFDPLQSLPEVPQSLTYSPAEAAANGVYIVQFNGPVEDAWIEHLVAAGGQIGPYIPNYAFIVRLDAATLNRVRGLPEVRWVGPYQAAYKLSENVTPADTRTYRVLLAPWASPDQATRAMSSFALRPVQNLAADAETLQADSPARPFDNMLAVDLTGSGLEEAARLGDVLWIEPVYLNKLFNNVGGGSIMGGQTAWNSGYTGAGQVINVTDSGLDKGSTAPIHQDFSGRVTNVASWPVVNADFGGGCVVQNAGANDGASDTKSGHGTHVTGSVAGSGAASGGVIKGLAYQSTINFQAVEQYTDFPPTCSGGDGWYLSGIPFNLTPMFQQAYDWGARIQNESWGGGYYGDYDVQAANFDSFIASHQDFAVLVAAGNDGTDTFEDDGWGDGFVDEGSISSPATAKNVITIGASENERDSGGYADLTYGYLWWDYYYAPTGTDTPSNNRQHMAAFSSRGPMDDGRIKPDLVAPGTNILSVRSSEASSDGWGPYDSNYMYMGGTSMASPLAAGAAAQVRQYYVSKGIANPSAALIKATLINSAVDMSGYGFGNQEAGQPIPNMHEGWGRIDVGSAVTPGRKVIDHPTGLTTNANHTYEYIVGPGKPFKVSLVWSDKAATPLAAVTLVNNLNLKVTAPNGAIYLGNVFSGGWSTAGGSDDTLNNVENVYIQSPVGGTWKVEVIGANVPQGPQRYALVVDGQFPPPADFSKTNPGNGATIPVNRTSISWGASTYATSYEYCYDFTNNGTCEGAWTTTGTANWKYLPGLTDDTTYYWQVRANNANGTTYANSNAMWSFNVNVIPLPFRNYLPMLRK